MFGGSSLVRGLASYLRVGRKGGGSRISSSMSPRSALLSHPNRCEKCSQGDLCSHGGPALISVVQLRPAQVSKLLKTLQNPAPLLWPWLCIESWQCSVAKHYKIRRHIASPTSIIKLGNMNKVVVNIGNSFNYTNNSYKGIEHKILYCINLA
jgi:hypothetical protein